VNHFVSFCRELTQEQLRSAPVGFNHAQLINDGSIPSESDEHVRARVWKLKPDCFASGPEVSPSTEIRYYRGQIQVDVPSRGWNGYVIICKSFPISQLPLLPLPDATWFKYYTSKHFEIAQPLIVNKHSDFSYPRQKKQQFRYRRTNPTRWQPFVPGKAQHMGHRRIRIRPRRDIFGAES
jgi:hypothetical protein